MMFTRSDNIHQAEIGHLYQSHALAIFAHCRTMLPEAADAADAVHDSFLRVLNHKVPQNDGISLRYLYRTSTNACIDAIRQQMVRRQVTQSIASEMPDISPEGCQANRNYLRVLFEKCDAITASIAVMYFVHGMNQVEVAKSLNISRRTVFNHLRRLERNATQLLSEEALVNSESRADPTGKGIS